ncbi:MAG: NAD-dependent epimerase/dehydratase family protein [Rhodospirillales bacterium]|jgi:UDP-glucose 4-epimerase|nr:NAD-dependent epimerase/dehydratase family protein [Rhodospirillales bacterium]
MTARQTAVVTGGAGFIGSHMVDLLLERGYKVRVIDNLSCGREPNLAQHARNPDIVFERRHIQDIKDDDSLFAGARLVFHFAGIGDIVPSIERPTDYISSNVMGTVRVLEAARRAEVGGLVYAASSSCYGLADVPTNENHPIDPRYPYALSKNLGEQAVFHWHQVYKLPVNSIRIFNAYGPRVRTTGAYGAVFGVFLRQKLAREPFTVVGDGTQRRDFVYVTDVADAFLRAAETSVRGEIFNLGNGDPQSINRLVELLGGEVVSVPERPGEPDCTWADISKIQSVLGWRPTVPFDEGVGRMLECIEDWWDAPLWTPKNISEATRLWHTHLSS